MQKEEERSMERLRMPSGVRFKPTDEDLVTHYLNRKIKGETLPSNVVKECCHVYGDKNPWEVFDIKNSVSCGGYFYCFTKLRKLSNNRINRSAGRGGTWKGRSSTTGENADGSIQWFKRDFVFETKDGGSASADNGHWIMQEFSLFNQRVEDDVLCRISNNAKDSNKKKRGRSIDEDPIKIHGRCCNEEIVIAPSRDEIQCNHDKHLAASTSNLSPDDDEEGDIQILHHPKKMRVSSPSTEQFDNREEKVDIVGNLSSSPSSNLLFANSTEQPFQCGFGDVQQLQPEEFLPVPEAWHYSFTDLLLSDDITPEIGFSYDAQPALPWVCQPPLISLPALPWICQPPVVLLPEETYHPEMPTTGGFHSSPVFPSDMMDVHSSPVFPSEVTNTQIGVNHPPLNHLMFPASTLPSPRCHLAPPTSLNGNEFTALI